MKNFLRRNGAWVGFLVLVCIMTVLTNGDFLAPRNLSNLMRQASINGILAGGMTLIILTGGIDLSIGSIVAVCGVLVGMSQVNWNWAAADFAGSVWSAGLSIGSGTLLGLITGLLIAWLGIAPFVITLGMMVIARGLALILSNGSSISPVSESLSSFANEYLSLPLTSILLFAIAIIAAVFVFKAWKSKGRNLLDLGFPALTFLLLAYAVISYKGFPILGLFLLIVLSGLGFILKYTSFGRSVYALGSNERAAFWAGVPIAKVTVLVYTIMGALAGLAGLLLTARLNGADPNAGQLFELDAIAAVVIGGTSLKGGQGSIVGSLIGALTIATLNNGMDLLSVPSFYQMVLKGIIIVFAVALDQNQRRSV